MTLEARPYQEELVAKISDAFRAGVPSVLLQLGTGGGKTTAASKLLARATSRGYRSLFLAHLDSLIGDTHARLTAAGVRAGYVQGDRPTDPEAPVQVGSIATLHLRGERPPADFVIVDECHRALAASVRGVLEAYPNAALLGLTATPQRGDGRPLGDVFDHIIVGPSNRWLTERGFLVPCELVWPGDYHEGVLAADPVSAYVKHARGRRAIVFATNTTHARDLVKRFGLAGFTADLMIGETVRTRREGLRARLGHGELQVLVGVGVFLEGFDCPEIEIVILARAFGVCGAFLQAIGRGLRPAPWIGKTRCLVLDLRGAVVNHGLPDEDRVWSLSGRAVRRAETITALSRCPECLAVFRPARCCPRCGQILHRAPKLPRVLTRQEKLVRFDALPQDLRDERYLERLVHVATSRMRMSDERAAKWATAQFRKRFKREPTKGAAA